MVQNSFVPTLSFAPQSGCPQKEIKCFQRKAKRRKSKAEKTVYVFFKTGAYFKIINTEIKRNLNALKIQINKSHCKNSIQNTCPKLAL